MTSSLMPSLPAHRVARTHPPAKLNLFLELLGKRNDGYHEIETVMVAIDWRDELKIRVTEEPGIRLRTEWFPSEQQVAEQLGIADDPARREALLRIPSDASNLVHPSLTRFGECFETKGGFEVELLKRIPAGAGMGGASSDAAAALRLAAALHAVSASDPRLVEIASEIGSDVPFFLGLGSSGEGGSSGEAGPSGGGGAPLMAAVARGRGERLSPLRCPQPLPVVVVYPDESLSTAAVYADAEIPRTPRSVGPLVAALERGSIAEIAATLHNRLADPAQKKSPRVKEILTELSQSGLMGGLMTGSGSACFALAKTSRQAEIAARGLRDKLVPGAIVVATQTVVLPAAIEIR